MTVEVGYALVIMQLDFLQSFLFMFLDVPQIQFNYRMPHIPVVCRGVGRRSAENRRVFTGAIGAFLRYAWFDSGYMFCASSWVLLDVFHAFST